MLDSAGHEIKILQAKPHIKDLSVAYSKKKTKKTYFSATVFHSRIASMFKFKCLTKQIVTLCLWGDKLHLYSGEKEEKWNSTSLAVEVRGTLWKYWRDLEKSKVDNRDGYIFCHIKLIDVGLSKEKKFNRCGDAFNCEKVSRHHKRFSLFCRNLSFMSGRIMDRTHHFFH